MLFCGTSDCCVHGNTHPCRGMYVVLLDEMDQLLQHPSAALIPQLLSMAGAPGSRLVLLGVANSIDLVERMLGGAEGVPHLQHMSFKAYTPVRHAWLRRCSRAALELSTTQGDVS